MKPSFKNTIAIVLAAGKGTRMSSEIPKVLHQINHKPIILYILDKLQQLNLGQIKIVVGYQNKQVKKALGKRWDYLIQKPLLGTGHAVLQALPHIPKQFTTILVINGDDSVFYKIQTLSKIIDQHLKSQAKLTIVTSIQEYAEVSGRIIRDQKGEVIDIKPNSQMSAKELQNNHEIVCGIYLFDRVWLEENLPKVEKGKSGEYNITGLIYTALASHQLQGTKLDNPDEWKSINSQNELIRARKLWQKLYGNRINRN